MARCQTFLSESDMLERFGEFYLEDCKGCDDLVYSDGTMTCKYCNELIEEDQLRLQKEVQDYNNRYYDD